MIVPVTFACNQGKVKKLNSEVEKLNKEKQELLAQSQIKDSSINDFTTTFNEIEANLAEIRQRENFIASNTQNGELRKDARQQVKEDIEMINQLLIKNKELIASLESNLSASNSKVKKFQGMIASLQRQIAEKDKDLAGLQDALVDMNFKVASLNVAVDTLTTKTKYLSTVTTRQSEKIAKQTEDLHTAYYIAGTYKELREKNIITKEGDIIGLGGKKTLAEDFNKDLFKKVDITQTTSIPLNSKKASLVTYHQNGTYELKTEDKAVESLIITDPEDFWGTSKYLVVVVN